MATPLVSFVKPGDAIDYTPVSAVTAGDVVVQVDLVGVAKLDIAAGVKGSLHVTGVFDFPTDTGSGSALPAGTKVYWDATSKILSTSSGDGKYLGKVVKAAADADATARVRMSQ